MVKIQSMKNWDDLRVFRAMAKARSIRAAAADLKTTHATVSRRIRALEDDLGSALFERRKEGYVLTAFGQSMMDLTQSVTAGVEAIDRLAFGQDGSLVGPVRLSVLEDLYHKVLADPLDSFMRDHPMIELAIETTSNFRDVHRREADVIVRITSDPPEQAVGRKVADSPLAAYCGRDYFRNRPAVDRWIALDYPPAITPQLNARSAFVANSLTVVADALRRGQGIGLLPCFMAEGDPDLVRLPEVEFISDKEIWTLTHVDILHNPRVRLLMDHLYRAFADQRGRIEGRAD